MLPAIAFHRQVKQHMSSPLLPSTDKRLAHARACAQHSVQSFVRVSLRRQSSCSDLLDSWDTGVDGGKAVYASTKSMLVQSPHTATW